MEKKEKRTVYTQFCHAKCFFIVFSEWKQIQHGAGTLSNQFHMIMTMLNAITDNKRKKHKILCDSMSMYGWFKYVILSPSELLHRKIERGRIWKDRENILYTQFAFYEYRMYLYGNEQQKKSIWKKGK